eukprot:gene10899-7557_t
MSRSTSKALTAVVAGLCVLLCLAAVHASADGTIETTQTILFDGTYEGWLEKLPGNTEAASAGIEAAIVTLLYRPFVTVSTSVTSISAFPDDPSFKKMGNGHGGLLVTVNIKEVVQPTAVHPYDASEINSLLFGLKVPVLTTLYGSEVVVQTVRDDQDYKLQCTPLCKGMIATGVILGTLMLVFFIILVLYSCCPSCFSKKEKVVADSPTWTNNVNPLVGHPPLSCAHQQPCAHRCPLRRESEPCAAHHPVPRHVTCYSFLLPLFLLPVLALALQRSSLPFYFYFPFVPSLVSELDCALTAVVAGLCVLLCLAAVHASADGTIETTQTILFDGTYEGWLEKLPGNTEAASAGIEAAIVTLLYRPFVTVSTSVTSISAFPDDPSFKKMGNGHGGLLVTVNIKEVVQPTAVHPYDASEINSLLFGLKVPVLTTLYGSEVVVQTVRDDQDYKLQCTPLCKGMIATGVILGTLMLVFFIILVLYSCCPSCFSKKEKLCPPAALRASLPPCGVSRSPVRPTTLSPPATSPATLSSSPSFSSLSWRWPCNAVLYLFIFIFLSSPSLVSELDCVTHLPSFRPNSHDVSLYLQGSHGHDTDDPLRRHLRGLAGKAPGNTEAASAGIEAAIVTLLYRPFVTVSTSVTSISAFPDDPSFKKMGNGHGGLLVTVNIKEVVQPTAVHPYDASEINSLLFGLKVPVLTTLYGSEVVVQTVRDDQDYKLQCTPLCKGMIATGVILGTLMLVFFIILVLYSCCPSCFSKKEKVVADSPTWTNNVNPLVGHPPLSCAHQQPCAHRCPLRRESEPCAAHHPVPPRHVTCYSFLLPLFLLPVLALALQRSSLPFYFYFPFVPSLVSELDCALTAVVAGLCVLLCLAAVHASADGTIETTQTILFDGTYEGWLEKLPGNTEAASAGIEAAIVTLLYRPFVTVSTSVTSISAFPDDPSFKKMGNGHGGLLVTVNIKEVVQPTAVHPYDASEINSLLFGLKVPVLTTLYGSEVVVQTVRDDQDYKLQCTPLCKGMIATGVILGTLMLVFFIILVLYSCCPSCFSKKEKEHKVSPPLGGEDNCCMLVERITMRRGIRQATQVILVFNDQQEFTLWVNEIYIYILFLSVFGEYGNPVERVIQRYAGAGGVSSLSADVNFSLYRLKGSESSTTNNKTVTLQKLLLSLPSIERERTKDGPRHDTAICCGEGRYLFPVVFLSLRYYDYGPFSAYAHISICRASTSYSSYFLVQLSVAGMTEAVFGPDEPEREPKTAHHLTIPLHSLDPSPLSSVRPSAITGAGWRVARSAATWSSKLLVWADTLTVPPPGPEEVRVKVIAAGVNDLDASLATSAGRLPRGIGFEGAGTVDCVGPSSGCSSGPALAPGDAVVIVADPSLQGSGTFSSYVNIPAALAVSMPPSTVSTDATPPARPMDFVEASAIPVAGVVVYLALMEKLRVEPGRTLLVYGASGGTGHMAVQLGHRLGLTVLASCSTPHLDFAQQCGADFVLDYTAGTKMNKSLVAQVRSFTRGYGVDYILDTSRADSPDTGQFVEMLRFGGALCVVSTSGAGQEGLLGGVAQQMMQKQVSVHTVSLLRLLSTPAGRRRWRAAATKMMAWYTEGRFDIFVEEVDHRQAPCALDVVHEGHTAGKLVLVRFHETAEDIRAEAMRRKAYYQHSPKESLQHASEIQ